MNRNLSSPSSKPAVSHTGRSVATTISATVSSIQATSSTKQTLVMLKPELQKPEPVATDGSKQQAGSNGPLLKPLTEAPVLESAPKHRVSQIQPVPVVRNPGLRGPTSTVPVTAGKTPTIQTQTKTVIAGPTPVSQIQAKTMSSVQPPEITVQRNTFLGGQAPIPVLPSAVQASVLPSTRQSVGLPAAVRQTLQSVVVPEIPVLVTGGLPVVNTTMLASGLSVGLPPLGSTSIFPQSVSIATAGLPLGTASAIMAGLPVATAALPLGITAANTSVLVPGQYVQSPGLPMGSTSIITPGVSVVTGGLTLGTTITGTSGLSIAGLPVVAGGLPLNILATGVQTVPSITIPTDNTQVLGVFPEKTPLIPSVPQILGLSAGLGPGISIGQQPVIPPGPLVVTGPLDRTQGLTGLGSNPSVVISGDINSRISQPVKSVSGATNNRHVGLASSEISDLRIDVPASDEPGSSYVPTRKKSSFQITKVITKDNEIHDVVIGDAEVNPALEHLKTTHSSLTASSDPTAITASVNEETPQTPPHAPSRFKIVKIESKDHRKRGRWVCFDFSDPSGSVDSTMPAPTPHSIDAPITTNVDSYSNAIYYFPDVDARLSAKIPFAPAIIYSEGHPVLERNPLESPMYQSGTQTFFRGNEWYSSNTVLTSSSLQTNLGNVQMTVQPFNDGVDSRTMPETLSLDMIGRQTLTQMFDGNMGPASAVYLMTDALMKPLTVEINDTDERLECFSQLDLF